MICEKCNSLQVENEKLLNEVNYKSAYLFEERSLSMKLQMEIDALKKSHEEKERVIAELSALVEKLTKDQEGLGGSGSGSSIGNARVSQRTPPSKVKSFVSPSNTDKRRNQSVACPASPNPLVPTQKTRSSHSVDSKREDSKVESGVPEEVAAGYPSLPFLPRYPPPAPPSNRASFPETPSHRSDSEGSDIEKDFEGPTCDLENESKTPSEDKTPMGDRRENEEEASPKQSFISKSSSSTFPLPPLGTPSKSHTTTDIERRKFKSTSSLSSGNLQMKPVVSSKMKKTTEDVVENDLVMFSRNFQVQIKGGTIPKIIERCTNESATDNSFVDIFLLTYRTYITPAEFLERLFERYHIAEPTGLDEAAQFQFNEARKIIRARVGNVIKRWLTHHYHDFSDNPAILNRLREIVATSFGDDPLGKSIVSLIDNERTKERVTLFNEEAPKPIIPTKNTFEDFDPLEIARQLCLFEQLLFRTIHTKECLNQGWNSKTMEKKLELSPNITRMIRHFNDVSFWVATQIMQQKKLEQRFKTLKKFIKIMRYSREFNNFNLIQEILAGLSNSAVFRLKKTWAKLEKDKKTWDELRVLRTTLAQENNYKAYRATLKNVNPPCLPYLGVFLTDLTFLEDGNPNILKIEGRNDIINFEKMRRVSVVIEKIVLYQQQPYNFLKVQVIYDYFESLASKNLSETDLFNLSLEVEPRE